MEEKNEDEFEKLRELNDNIVRLTEQKKGIEKELEKKKKSIVDGLTKRYTENFEKTLPERDSGYDVCSEDLSDFRNRIRDLCKSEYQSEDFIKEELTEKCDEYIDKVEDTVKELKGDIEACEDAIKGFRLFKGGLKG